MYQGIDKCRIDNRPDNDMLCKALDLEDYVEAEKQFVNVLENYTVKEIAKVESLKTYMEEEFGQKGKVMMTGSGPTVFALLDNIDDAKEGCKKLRSKKYEAYWCKTTK